jgi:hypothetical protein
MDRNIHLSENPLGYLLPEMQSIRELARNQRIRCRLAIAENRIPDAIEIIAQQVTLSHHLGMDDFLVSNLVGCAALRIALDDTMLLIQHPDCPNLYWALAQLPSPLVSPDQCLAVEKQLGLLQVPKLREIDTTLRPPSYWTEFIEEFARRTTELDLYTNDNSGPTNIISKAQGELRVQSIRKSIEENVPQAKAYLISRGILTAEAVSM